MTINPTIMLTLGKSSLFKKPVFLFISPTSESIGSKFSDIIFFLSVIHSIKEKELFVIYRFVRRILNIKNTPMDGGITSPDPHL